jgi:membrane protease YdiL (CAAX protease family)
MIYRIAFIINIGLSIIFIALSFIGTFMNPVVDSSAWSALLFLLVGYGGFLLFDIHYLRLLSFNKDRQPLSNRFIKFGKVIFIFGILALLSVLLMTIAASYVFITDMEGFPERQRPVYLVLIGLFLLSDVSFMFLLKAYLKAKKNNRVLLNNYINDIGLS